MNRDFSGIDSSVVATDVHKIKVCANYEREILSKIKKCLEEMGNYYQSKAANELHYLNGNLVRNFPVLIENRRGYTTAIESVMSQYDDVVKANVRIFQDAESVIGKIR